MKPRRPCVGLALIAALLVHSGAWADGTIDTAFLREPWPRQSVRELEVGRYPVRWRQAAPRGQGIFGGVRFRAPLAQARLWELTTDYSDVGTLTPGVQAVRILEQTPTAQVLELDVQVLWKTLTLRFRIEQDPPHAMRFRLVHDLIGEYRGVCWLEPAPEGTGTMVELATWLQPGRPVPAGLILLVERMMFLQATEAFLEACDAEAQRSAAAAAGVP